MTYIQVKPKDGLHVLQPDNFYNPMPASGTLVPYNPHYAALLQEGSIERVPDELPAPPPTAALPQARLDVAPVSSSLKAQ